MEQVLDGIASEQVGLEQDVSFINHKGDIFIWIDTQLDQLAAYFVERVVGGHDLDGGMTFDIFSYYFPFPTSSIDTQQHVAMLMDLVLDQPHEGYCDDGVTWLLDGKGGSPTACHTLVEYAVGGNLVHSFGKGSLSFRSDDCFNVHFIIYL